MGPTFSTLQRDVSRGNVFSAAKSQDKSLRPNASVVQVPAPRAIRSPAAGRIRFDVTTRHFPPGALTVPGSFASDLQGHVTLDSGAVTAHLGGLKPHLWPGGQLTLWLVRDLPVPLGLAPADAAAIAGAAANQPGTLFTWDGEPATVGRTDLPGWNTLSLACPAGTLELQASGHATLAAPLQPTQTLDPRSIAGLPGIPQALIPSGLAAQILGGTFMQPVTRLPHLPLTNLPARLEAVATQALGAADIDQDGQVSVADLERVPQAFLSPDSFNRVIITLEPPGSPGLQPTLSQVVAMGLTAVRD